MEKFHSGYALLLFALCIGITQAGGHVFPVSHPGTCPAVNDSVPALCIDPPPCGTDWDCEWSEKCCFTGCSHMCVESVQNAVSSSGGIHEPNQHVSQSSSGHCPHGFSKYNPYEDPGCPYECKGDSDCSNGEVCCVANPGPHRESSEGRCPVCKTPVTGVGCYDYGYYDNYEYYEDNAIFTPEYGGCAICQCRNGYIHCFNTCDRPFALREWIVPGITMAATLLILLVVSMCVCCCVKCCCKTRRRTVHYGPQMQQMPQQHIPVPQTTTDERAPLTNYNMA